MKEFLSVLALFVLLHAGAGEAKTINGGKWRHCQPLRHYVATWKLGKKVPKQKQQKLPGKQQQQQQQQQQQHPEWVVPLLFWPSFLDLPNLVQPKDPVELLMELVSAFCGRGNLAAKVRVVPVLQTLWVKRQNVFQKNTIYWIIPL